MDKPQKLTNSSWDNPDVEFPVENSQFPVAEARRLAEKKFQDAKAVIAAQEKCSVQWVGKDSEPSEIVRKQRTFLAEN